MSWVMSLYQGKCASCARTMSCPFQNLPVACVSPVSMIPKYVFVLVSEEGLVMVFQITACEGEGSVRGIFSKEADV